MNKGKDETEVVVNQRFPGILAKPVIEFVRALAKLIHAEPTCIKCGCTEDNACPGGCSWTFLNKKTNEGLCSACFTDLAIKDGH